MIRNRPQRALATLALTFALAASALVGPAAVLAAQADAIFSATPVLDRVSPSTDEQASYIGYDLSFRVDPAETSNLSQLYLLATTPAGWDLWTVDGATRPGCGADASGNLFCSFGAIDAQDDPIELTVVYKVGEQTGNANIDFAWNTTGVAGDRKKKSHGDSYISSTTVSVENDANFGASYPQNIGDVVGDATNLGRNNPQYTKVTSPAADIIVTVGEDSEISQCTELFGGCFGQASVLNVDNGNPNLGTFTVQIGINVNKPNGQFVHFFDDGTYEELGSCGETPVAPCASVTTSQGKTFVTAYLTENGKIIGH
jgi:hypothetical protein